jgi:hypothetical protein
MLAAAQNDLLKCWHTILLVVEQNMLPFVFSGSFCMWAAQFTLSSSLEINFSVFPRKKKSRKVMSGEYSQSNDIYTSN